MADTEKTNTAATSPNHVATITMVAQIVGTLLTAYGAVFAAWAASHSETPWPGIALALSGVALSICTHYGYSKSETLTQNTIVNALVSAAASPLAVALVMGFVQKKAASLPVVAPVIPPEPQIVVGMPADRPPLPSSGSPK